MLNFKTELNKLTFFEPTDSWIPESNELQAICQSFQKTLTRIHKDQKEISMHVEELSDIVEGNKTVSEKNSESLQSFHTILKQSETQASALVRSLIAMADTIEDFYLFSLESNQKSYINQANMMWSQTAKHLSSCGVTRIFSEQTPFDPALNTIVSTENVLEIPQGIVMKTLYSGYIYQNKVLRKSKVIVNKHADFQ